MCTGTEPILLKLKHGPLEKERIHVCQMRMLSHTTSANKLRKSLIIIILTISTMVTSNGRDDYPSSM
jgi:hypothetical protein